MEVTCPSSHAVAVAALLDSDQAFVAPSAFTASSRDRGALCTQSYASGATRYEV